MARTWSAPQWGNFADFNASGALRRTIQANWIATAWPDPHRSLLLVVAAGLTLAGAAIPHMDDESLSKMLFLAGAGLAALLLCTPWQTRQQETPRTAPIGHRPATARVAESAQFAELFSHPKVDAALDRAAWAKLTAHMSHELRTPLNAVLGFSEMMSNEIFGPLGSSCYSAYARDIHASGRLLLKSAEDALAITALLTSPERKGPPVSSSLSAVAEEACAFAKYDLAAKSITIVSNIPGDLDIIGDAQGNRQMLINLLAEAAGNARSGAELTVEARNTPHFIRLSISILAGGVATDSKDDGFPMILARTLCELSNASLTRTDTVDGAREWTVNFLPVAQSDLFSRPA